MELRPWGVVAVAVVCCGGCAQSHAPATEPDPAPLEGAQDLEGVKGEDVRPALVLPRCGAADPELPVLLGTDGPEVWLRWLDGHQQHVHSFDRDDPALDPGAEPVLQLAAGHLLLSIDGQPTEQDTRARSHALLTRSGELLWAHSWSADEGGDVAAFGADGSVLLWSRGRYSWLQPDGSERLLAAGFTPLSTPDAEGWMPGIFGQGDAVTVRGFQHAATDEKRVLAGETRSDLRELGRPELADGRFYYTFIDTAGVVGLGVEGPGSERTQVLEGESELPSLTGGPTHTLVHVGTRPAALLERATLKLTPLEGPAESDDSAEDRRQRFLRADGDWFVLTVELGRAPLDAAHPDHAPPAERVYRIHAPTGRLDAEPAPPLPEGLARFDYSTCWASTSQSVDSQLVQALAPLDEETPLVRLYVEGLDDEGWTVLGQPIAYGMGPGVQRVGETWVLRAGDVRNTYCNYPWFDDPSALGPEVLVGNSVQVVAPDGEVVAFEGQNPKGQLEERIALSADGSCALIASEDRTWIHDLVTHEEQDLDLPNARWLHDLGEPR